MVKWHEEPETRQMGTFSNQNHLLLYQIVKITQDLGFQRVSDESAKFQILPIFLTGNHGDKNCHFQNIFESVQYGSHLFGTDVRSNPVKFKDDWPTGSMLKWGVV